MKGIDLSQWNTVKDYEAIKAAGYDFAIIRSVGSSKGKRYHDKSFVKHYEGCTKAGLHVGAYAYFQPHLSGYNALDDALYFLDNFRAGMHFDFPIYLDCETWIKDKKNNTKYCVDFLETLEKRGFFAGLYGSDISTFHDLVYKEELKPYSWWVARYGKKPNYATENCHIWQKTSSGTVPGVIGRVDLNECYKNFPEIIERNHLNIRK